MANPLKDGARIEAAFGKLREALEASYSDGPNPQSRLEEAARELSACASNCNTFVVRALFRELEMKIQDIECAISDARGDW